MKDKKLILAAAGAVNLRPDTSFKNGGGRGNHGFDICGNLVLDWHNSTTWNPLENDTDAFKLVVDLGLLVHVEINEVDRQTEVVWNNCYHQGGKVRIQHDDDPYQATRLAITMAAAAIYENTPLHP